MKRNIERILKEAERLNMDAHFYLYDAQQIIHTGKGVYDIVLKSILYGAVIGYRQALKDMKKR